MKIILSTNGYGILVDDKDFEWLNQWKWYAHKDHKYERWYAHRQVKTNSKSHTIQMHFLIMNTPKGLHTDHINHNGLDNQRNNLRICSNSQNQHNRQRRKYRAYKGICECKNHRSWIAQIVNKGNKEYIGVFGTPIEAAQAYDNRAREIFGEFACLNFP